MTARRLTAPARKSGERGFALLIVFLFAAAVALMLYQQMPRVAFESERDKEQVLQDRGHEYVRGIQLYYKAFNKYPSKIEDLENTNNKRFLRRRYIDPMTGKDEWRLIHVNGAGQLIDSVVQKPPAPPTGDSHDPNNPLAAFGTGAGSSATGALTGTGAGAAGIGTGTPNGQPAVNAAVLRRPSDNSLVPPGGIVPPNVDPNDPRYWPPTTTVPILGANGQPLPQFPGQQQFPGQPQFPGQQQYPGQPQFPGQQQYPGQLTGTLPGGFQPGLPGQPNPLQGANPNNNLIPGSPGAGGGVPGGVMPGGGVYGFPSNGQGSGGPGGAPGSAGSGPGAANPALGGISQFLTTPQQGVAGNTGAIGVGGLVGVASMSKGPSIKIFKDRQKYNEWEFIFDLKSLTAGQGPNAQPGLGQNGGLGPNGAGPNGAGPSGAGPNGAGGSSIFPNGNSIFPPTGGSSTTTNH